MRRTIEQFRQELITACDRAGGQKAWARRHGVPQSLVSMTVTGKREPAETILNALGYVRRVVFERVRG